MVYDLSVFDHSLSLLDILGAANDLTLGFFSVFILASVFIISFVVFKKHDTKTVVFGSSLITTFICILMKIAGLVSDKWIIVCSVVLGISMFVMLWRSDQ